MAEYMARDLFLKNVKHNAPFIYSIVAPIALITPVADVAPVRHGRWILEANKERTNYRWNVTAECSECCDEKKEIWGGFFPNVPDCIARDVALVSAESVKLSNYCPNCGARMNEA